MNNGEYAILKSMVNSETAFSVYKTAEDQRLVFGWANVAIRTDGKTIVDSQNDIIAPEDLALAAYDYVLNFRESGTTLPCAKKPGWLKAVFLPKKRWRLWGFLRALCRKDGGLAFGLMMTMLGGK